MQFTAAFVAAALAITAAALPQQHLDDPRKAICSNQTVKRADCESAIDHLRKDPRHINFGAGCDFAYRPQWTYITVGTCTVSVHVEGGDAHCKQPGEVAQGVVRISEKCDNKGGEYEIEPGFKIVVTSARA